MGAATFGWLCVETTELDNALNALREQPPSGGCVLKRQRQKKEKIMKNAATFGWLCVETLHTLIYTSCYTLQPPSGGCVLKP